MTVVVDRPPALIHPVGLCADTDRRRLYWFDAEYHAVASTDYDGSDLVVRRFHVGVVNLLVYKVRTIDCADVTLGVYYLIIIENHIVISLW